MSQYSKKDDVLNVLNDYYTENEDLLDAIIKDVEDTVPEHDVTEVIRCGECSAAKYSEKAGLYRCSFGYGHHSPMFFCADGTKAEIQDISQDSSMLDKDWWD